MNKEYTLVVGHNFSLVNETDANPYTDYNPGIWSIKTQKMALKYARETLNEGNTVKVIDYNNPSYHSLANWFIKELGIKQPLFTEPENAPTSSVTLGNIPSTLAGLKKYLTVGKKIRIINYVNLGNAETTNTRETEIVKTQSESIVTKRDGHNCWLDFGKASSWSFDNTGATHFTLNKDGKMEHSFRIEYLN